MGRWPDLAWSGTLPRADGGTSQHGASDSNGGRYAVWIGARAHYRAIRGVVDRAGYRGPIEVEIFNEQVWGMPLDDVMRLTKDRFVAFA